MANIVSNISVAASPTVGTQPALNQTFSTTLPVTNYSEIVTTVTTSVTLASLLGFTPTSMLRLRNITPTGTAGADTAFNITVSTTSGSVALFTLSRNGEATIIPATVTGALAATWSVSCTGSAASATLYIMAA